MATKGKLKLEAILQHSQLDIAGTSTSLISAIDEILKTGFKPEDFELFNDRITILNEIIGYIGYGSDAEKIGDSETPRGSVNGLECDKKFESVVCETFQKVCIPVLNNLYPTQSSDGNVLILLGGTAQLVASCIRKNVDILTDVMDFVIGNIEILIQDVSLSYGLPHDKSTPDICTQLEILRHVLNVIPSIDCLDMSVLGKLSSVFEKLTSILKNLSNEIIGTSCVPVLIKILNVSVNYDELMMLVWNCMIDCTQESDGKVYLLLCGFANHFFPVSGQLRNTSSLDVRKDNQFWEILQSGLYSKDSLSRKRSLYLLKRIVDICESNNEDVNEDVNTVFWWTKKKCSILSKVWEDFLLLAEVLEEKQVHVIKPLLPRMKNLLKASCNTGDNERPLLHTSWLKTVLLRSTHHESLQIIRWSAETVLTIDLNECPMIQQGLDQYLAGEMLYSLREAKLYIKEPTAPTGTLPVIADKLVQFFSTCWHTLPEDKKVSFFNLTLRNIAARDWGHIPLLFICRGISMVPQSPCIDSETVLCLRKVLTGFLITMDTYFRGAIQGYIVQILIKLTDKSKVSLDDFMQIVSLIKQEESLQRGTTLWSQCIKWLTEEVDDASDWTLDGISHFVETSVEKYLQTSIDSKYSLTDGTTAGNIARLLLLVTDASLATKKDNSNCTTLSKTLETLVSLLNSINSHAYMSCHKADKALLMLILLVKEAGPCDNDNVTREINSSIEKCMSEITVYIGRQMYEHITNMEDLGVLQLYVDGIDMLMKCVGTKCIPYIISLVDRCVHTLSQGLERPTMREKLHELTSVCILGKISSILVLEDDTIYTDIRNKICVLLKTWKVVSNFSKPVGEQSLSHQEWGRVTSLFLEQEWQVILLVLQYGHKDMYDIQELLNVAEDTLSVGLEQTTVIVLKCLKLIINLVKDSVTEERLLSVLSTCWSCLQESRRLLAYWDVLEAFIQAVYQCCLLEMDESSPVVKKLVEFANDLIEIGTDKNGVVNVLSTQLYRTLSQPNMLLHLNKYITVIVNLCKFGGLVRRGVRQVYDICAALEQDGKACPANELLKGIQNEDIKVRVAVISLLCSLKLDVPDHRNLATNVIETCLQVYCDIAKTSTNRFANSMVHRERHRLIQTVLLLQGFVTDEYVNTLWNMAWSSLEFETQPSVRHMLEWLILWLMKRFQQFRPQLWILFEKYRDSKNLTLCSLLCIVIHLGPHLPQHEQKEYFKTAMPYILPWCMAHHFQTRIYSQAVLAKLWDQCRLLGLDDILKENAILQSIFDFTQQNKNSTKNVKKLLDSFVFKYLDFERDFTIETLYKIMPQMTALSEEDWINPDAFIELDCSWSKDTASDVIGLRNTSRSFEDCDPGLWKYIGLKVPEDNDAADDTVNDDNDVGDVQKKIMPWRQMMLDEETIQEVDHGVKQVNNHGLVVVTSLINKVPNLGGLCRTSEIFGVSEYVMSKLGNVDDKAFQGLSVTAHKWIPITEVPEAKLSDYLEQKRFEGYTLVGVEQTANSVSLTDYTFPQKTLLLLGNEKEGIPVDLISSLDVCVEIPQQGVIRSLNVHVSGAILIWEYRRQQLMKALT
ncbi:hypothetical protein ACF0H5_002865 [Mactra antiquata]